MHVFSNKTYKHYAVLEYVSIDKRTLVGNLGLAVALTVSGVYQPWLAKYLGHWKTFNWAIFSQVRSDVMTMIVKMINDCKCDSRWPPSLWSPSYCPSPAGG